MYQIAICDDEISDLQHNIQLTESIMAKAGLPCSIAAYESSQTLLSDIQTGRHFDLLLLDVLMGELDGHGAGRRAEKVSGHSERGIHLHGPGDGHAGLPGGRQTLLAKTAGSGTASRSSAPLL